MFSLYNPINFKRLPYVISNIMVQFLTYILIINLSLDLIPLEFISVIITMVSQFYFIYTSNIKQFKHDFVQDIKRNKRLSETFFNNTFGIFIGQFYIVYLILSSGMIGWDFWSNIFLPIVVILFYISTLRANLLICTGSNQIIFNNEMKSIIEANYSKHTDCALTSLFFTHPLDLDLDYYGESGFYWKNVKLNTVEDKNGELIEGHRLNFELDFKDDITEIKAVTFERISPADENDYLITNYTLYNYRLDIHSNLEMTAYGNIIGPKMLMDSWLLNYDRSENEQKAILRFSKELEKDGIKIDKMILKNMFQNYIYSSRLFYFTCPLLSYKRLKSLDQNFVDRVNRFNNNIVNLLTYKEFNSCRNGFLSGLLKTMYGTDNTDKILEFKSNKASGREGEITRYKKLFMANGLTVLDIDRVNENFKITE